MASIVGFGFTRISGERKSSHAGKIDVSTNVILRSVSDANVGLGSGQKSLKVEFLYETKYEPSVGALSLEGDLLLLLPLKEGNDVLALWSKKSELPKELAAQVLNGILGRCSVQALIMSRDLGLPPPVKLPRVQISKPSAGKLKPAKKK